MGLNRAWPPPGNSTMSLNWVPPSFCTIDWNGSADISSKTFWMYCN